MRHRRHGRRGAPLLLVVEDIHWADAWTLERLAALAVLAARQPLLLVMTTRFAGDPSAGAWRTSLHGAPLTGIDLGPLTSDDSQRLAALASTMPAALVASCVERAEGNPLFLLQLLLDAGAAAQTSLPGSIQALVHTRMDRLAAEDKAALQAASVLGQRFAIDALRHLLDRAGYDPRLLVENFLVRADSGEFMFCHALIRDGAYASLLHKRRRALHARAAEWFASRDRVLAAEHFDRADDPRAAAAYLDASLTLAEQFRHAAALALVERGLALAVAQETRFALLMARGRLLVELGRPGDAIEAARAALEAAVERRRARTSADRDGRGHARQRPHRRRPRRARRGRAAGRPRPALALDLSRLHHLRGNLLFPLGRDADCVREHELARRLARDAGSLEAEAAAMGGLGDGYYLQGRMRSANRQFQACVAMARANGFGRLEVANLSMIGWTGMHLAELSAAVGGGTGSDRARLARVPAARRDDGALARRLGRRPLSRPARRGRAADRGGARAGANARRAALRSAGPRRPRHARAARRRARARAPARRRRRSRSAAFTAWATSGPGCTASARLAEDDPDARSRWLDEGERAARARLRQPQPRPAARGRDRRRCSRSATSTASSATACASSATPRRSRLPMSDWIVGRGRALARVARGERGDALAATLQALRDEGTRAEMFALVPALDAAIAQVASASPN